MQSQSNHTQVTFYYVNGQSESFVIPDPIDVSVVQQEVQQRLRHILDRPWWIIRLGDQTVVVNTANLLKLEIKPPIAELHGEDVFSNAERVTALSRNYRE